MFIAEVILITNWGKVQMKKNQYSKIFPGTIDKWIFLASVNSSVSLTFNFLDNLYCGLNNQNILVTRPRTSQLKNHYLGLVATFTILSNFSLIKEK